jgi:phosphoglycerate-specific signal transduction histidine kinase
MDAIKLILIILFFTPIFTYGQKSIYPKDTIYVKFEKKNYNKKMEGNYNSKNNNKLSGIYFYLKDSINRIDRGMSLFYDYNQKADTLCIKNLKNYQFSNLREIREKQHKWIFDNKRPPADRNGVFQTFLIEIISKDYFVIYSVIWRNEGATD